MCDGGSIFFQAKWGFYVCEKKCEDESKMGYRDF